MSEPETDARKALIHRLDEGGYEWEEVHALIDDIEAELRVYLAAKVRALPYSFAGHTCWDDHEGPDAGHPHADGTECHDKLINESVTRAAVLALIEGSDPASRSWPGRAEMEAMTNAEVNDVLESRGLDVRVIEGSDPASPEDRHDMIATLAVATKEPEMTYRDLLLEFIQWCVDNPPEAIFEDGDAAKDAVDAFLEATDPRDESERAFDAAYWPEPAAPQVNKDSKRATGEGRG